MTDNTSGNSCTTCGKLLPDAGRFCPFCGYVTIQNTLIESKTTAGFDPYNRDFKPWRDAPLLPKRVYKTDTVSVKLPWCPPMRTLQPRKLKVKVRLKDAPLSDGAENALEIPELTTHTNANGGTAVQSICDEQPDVDCSDAHPALLSDNTLFVAPDREQFILSRSFDSTETLSSFPQLCSSKGLSLLQCTTPTGWPRRGPRTSW